MSDEEQLAKEVFDPLVSDLHYMILRMAARAKADGQPFNVLIVSMETPCLAASILRRLGVECEVVQVNSRAELEARSPEQIEERIGYYKMLYLSGWKKKA